MTDGTTTWDYSYNANGLRTQRTDGTTTYSYVYDGSQLKEMTVGSNTLQFAYDANGTPLTVTFNGTTYYYMTNLQGDVVKILNPARVAVVNYNYDAWGNILSWSGSMISTLGRYNPLTYRGYVYDFETNLYYLQSRYYNPETGRFLNADAFAATGQGLLGNNMFAYCLNNPVNFVDTDGNNAEALFAWWVGSAGWLCIVDNVLPIGDLIFVGGLIVISALSFELSAEIASEITSWDYSSAESVSASPSVTTSSSVLDVVGRIAASKPVNLPPWKKLTVEWEHIKTGHMPGGSRNPKGNKSVFYGLTFNEIKKAIEEAYNNSSRIFTQGDRILLNGYAESYNILIEIWLNVKDLKIETAYPK